MSPPMLVLETNPCIRQVSNVICIFSGGHKVKVGEIEFGDIIVNIWLSNVEIKCAEVSKEAEI